MARKRRHRRGSDAVIQPQPLATLIRPQSSFTPLVLVEDRRTYHPDPHRPARQLSGHPVRPNIVQPNVNKRSSSSARFKTLSPRVRFAAPRDTVICVRRQRRKEVLHAIKRTGKGIRRRRPRRNAFSEVSCK